MRSPLFGLLLAAGLFLGSALAAPAPVLAAPAGALAAPAPAPASSSLQPARAAIPAAYPMPTLVAFRSHFGFGRSRGGYGFGRFSRSRPRHSLLRRVVKTAIWLYVLHLFFSHGGLSILLWIVIMGLVVSLLRRRRRRYVY